MTSSDLGVKLTPPFPSVTFCHKSQNPSYKMTYVGQWLVCAVCDGHCWDDYFALQSTAGSL